MVKLMGANMGQWLMHERQYFRLMDSANCKIRPKEGKEVKGNKQCVHEEKKMLADKKLDHGWVRKL